VQPDYTLHSMQGGGELEEWVCAWVPRVGGVGAAVWVWVPRVGGVGAAVWVEGSRVCAVGAAV